MEEEGLVHGALRSAAGTHADAANAAGDPGSSVRRQHAVAVL